MTTTAEYVFEIRLHGVEIPSVTTFRVPEQRLTAELQPGTPLRLMVRFAEVPEQQAESHATRFVKELYIEFLRRFGENIERSEPPRLVCKSFTKDGSVNVTAMAAGVALAVGRLTAIVGQLDVDQIAKNVELRVITPMVPTSAQLYTATEMYAAGLETQNRVVRFLVFYSALALAALFKWNNGRQQDVDKLILDRNPAVPQSNSPKTGMKETLYTKLRNDLIHAEERGCDPAGAIAEIEKHIGQFQKDVSLVFSHL